ncbi:MAG: aldehyde dehydrogenase family protein [Acidobacteria bacterium]|nr:aldehyde dehydrogenase family protein [Acidobacteriota bacterium]
MTDVTPMRIGADLVTTEESVAVCSPYDGREVGRVPVGTEAHLDAAVAIAVVRRDGEPLPAWRRAEILDRAAVRLAERHEEFAQRIAAEAAKPIRTARVEVTRAVDTFRFSATAARTLTGETIPIDASVAGGNKLAFVRRVPIGVVAAISPFNFPVNLVVHKIGPAIAAGCPVVLKPASATPLSALALADLLIDDCGLPPGWLNVVTCPGSVANHLVEHEDVALITFTGSPPVGWGIRARAPRKRVGLELGNNAPVIVEPSADVASTAEKITAAATAFAGQSCISVQRVFVHRTIAEAFVERLVEGFAGLVVGDPADEATAVSAMIDRGETERVAGWITEAVDAGAHIAVGGSIDDHGVLQPTVLVDVTPDMEVCRTEVFGPLVGVQLYDDVDEALRLANDSRYGLQAGIFTADLDTAMKAAARLDFGGVLINEVPTWRADQMPYGGLRDSGNTREGPAYAVREMTEERLVVIHSPSL